MASILSSVCLLESHSFSLKPSIFYSKHRISATALKFRAKFQLNSSYLNWNPRKPEKKLLVAVCCSSESSDKKSVEDEVQMEKNMSESEKHLSRLRATVGALPPALYMIKRQIGTNFAVWLCIAIPFLVIVIREYVTRKSRHNHHGSVADLVKRGQLRSDRRGISTPLKYDDPFNNPLVKVSKSNSSVEMCGKVYRLAPVTLTEEEQSNHQKRRSRAYQWKRPTMFIKEGDVIPPDVDPDTVRWIPANHPFATTASDIDEDLAQNNVYQKHGVPFRIQAEHEALQRKLEALQNDQKLDKLVIDPGSARDFARPYNSLSKSHEHTEQRRPPMNQGSNSSSPKSDRAPNSFESNTSSEELQKP